MHTLMVDAGQTGVQSRIEGRDGMAMLRELPGVRGDRHITSQIETSVARLLSSATAVGAVHIGLSGLDGTGSVARHLLERWRPLGVNRVLLAHDSVTAALGSLGTAPGVVLAIGTGIVTLGVGPAMLWRVDGWGNVLGDAGSAYWIGRAGLDAALRDSDGRGPSTALRQAAESSFGALSQAVGVIQRSPRRVAEIAGFAPVVTRFAETDNVAMDICRSAVNEYVTSVGAAARNSGLIAHLDHPVRVTWAGSVLSSSEVLRALLGAAIPPGHQLSAPVGEPLDGVALLGQVTKDPVSPFFPHIDDSDHPK